MWLPNSREPHSITYFGVKKKEVIENLGSDEIDEIRSLLNGKLTQINTRALKLLKEKGVVYQSHFFNDFDFSGKYSRQIISYCNYTNFDKALDIHQQIIETTFIVIGVGGAGSNAIMQLLSMGVRKFVLIDPDIVELSNLNRQIIFSIESIGKPKVLEAKKYIHSITAGQCQVKPLQEDILSLENMETIVSSNEKNFVVSSADSHQVGIRRFVASTFYKLKIPYIFLGYYGMSARVGPMIIDHNGACGICDSFIFNFEDMMELAEGSSTVNIAPSSLSVNTLMAALFSNQIVQWLAGNMSKNSTYSIELDNLEIKTLETKKRNSCKICGENKHV